MRWWGWAGQDKSAMRQGSGGAARRGRDKRRYELGKTAAKARRCCAAVGRGDWADRRDREPILGPSLGEYCSREKTCRPRRPWGRQLSAIESLHGCEKRLWAASRRPASPGRLLASRRASVAGRASRLAGMSTLGGEYRWTR